MDSSMRGESLLLRTVAQAGFARTPLTRPFSWPPSSAVVKEPPRVFRLCLDHHVSAFEKVGVCLDISRWRNVWYFIVCCFEK